MALFVTGEGDALVDLFVARFTSKLFVVMLRQNKTKQKIVVVMHDVGGLQYPYSGFHQSRA
jgi:hypothetical protein